MSIALIAVDADDTLWHNETIFRSAQARFETLMAPFASPERVGREIDAVERRNLSVYGYGAKGFTLSMLEAALDLSDGAISGAAMAEILDLGRAMMRHPIEPLPGVPDAIERLSSLGPLVLITKGDLFHQESKLAASGLGAWFTGVEVVSEKTPETYRAIFARYGVTAERAVMAGNSVRSDIRPALDAGAYAALIPYPLVWSHEAAEPPHGHPRFRQLAGLTELAGWIEELGRA